MSYGRQLGCPHGLSENACDYPHCKVECYPDSERSLKHAFIAGWNTGLNYDWCTSSSTPTDEELAQMANDDWEEYLERTV